MNLIEGKYVQIIYSKRNKSLLKIYIVVQCLLSDKEIKYLANSKLLNMILITIRHDQVWSCFQFYLLKETLMIIIWFLVCQAFWIRQIANLKELIILVEGQGFIVTWIILKPSKGVKYPLKIMANSYHRHLYRIQICPTKSIPPAPIFLIIWELMPHAR